MLTITEAAQKRIGEIVQEAGQSCAGLRIRAARLGQHTFRYQMHLMKSEDILPDDKEVSVGEVKAFLDPDSVEYLTGAKVDFVLDPDGGGFDIDNPAAKPEWSDPLAQKVQQVIDAQISPSLAGHGGFCELVEVKDNVAHVRLGGGCQGCGGAHLTVKNGIEAVIIREVPEIREVVDQTDHAGGAAPYMSGCCG